LVPSSGEVTTGRVTLCNIELVRALAFVGGWAHPSAQTGPPTADALASLGIDCLVADTFSAATVALTSGEIDLLVVHACRFQMVDSRYTQAQREEHASLTPPDFREAVVRHLDLGRPMLALHTAALCFDDWPAWSRLVGATWSWERSNHPPPGAFLVEPTNEPSVVGLDRFEVFDELYRFVTPADDARVIARATDDVGIDHPIAWLREADARVAYNALGHDARSLANTGHRALLGRIINWLTDE
jgi:uncharacterized protein